MLPLGPGLYEKQLFQMLSWLRRDLVGVLGQKSTDLAVSIVRFNRNKAPARRTASTMSEINVLGHQLLDYPPDIRDYALYRHPGLPRDNGQSMWAEVGQCS